MERLGLMSPLYEFLCHPCDYKVEELRKMADYTSPVCECGEDMEWVISAPAVDAWNSERKFPNVTQHGDGTMTFKSKDAYKAHLKANHSAEYSHTAPIKTSHGAEVTVYENS